MATTREYGHSISEDVKARSAPKEAPYIYDQIILGGGPAGLTAAVYSARKRIDLLLLTEDIGGQMLWTSDIENYMGYHYITAHELIDKFHNQVKQFPIDLVTEDGASTLGREGEALFVNTKSGKRFAASTLIIASGKRSRSLNVPGEKEYIGRGVTYCAVSDGPCFKGMDVAIIGGGNSGLTVAVEMAPLAKSVCCVNNSPTLRADMVLIERAKSGGNVEFLLGYDVKEIRGNNNPNGKSDRLMPGPHIPNEPLVRSIVLQNRATSELVEKSVRGVFVEIGLVPNSEFCENFLDMNPWREIVVDAACKTSVTGVFAAGDVSTVPEKQIIVAAGEGAKASLSAYYHLTRKRGDSK